MLKLLKRVTATAISTVMLAVSCLSASPFTSINTAAAFPTVTYRCHVQNIGDMKDVSNGAICGTTGRSLRMEYLDVKLSGVSGGIRINGHLQDIGWTGEKTVSAGNYVGIGTKGQSRRLEAVTMSLTGNAANMYSISYRVHVQDIGWMPFVEDGAIAGTTGRSLRIEAIQIKLIKKQENKRQAVVSKALGEVGTKEIGNNNVKYNTWYWGRTINSSGYAWCDAFVSWCADQCKVGTDVIPKAALVANTKRFYTDRNRFYKSKYYGGNYTPKAGDLVFYGSYGTSHIGIIVASPVNGYLQVVEGNVLLNNQYQVAYFTKNSKRTINSSYVYGYASPDY